MDIEAHECRAFMGSQGIFSDPRFDIIAISIEWNYVKDGQVIDLCPLPMLKSFVRLLVQNSFEPTEYREDNTGSVGYSDTVRTREKCHSIQLSL